MPNYRAYPMRMSAVGVYGARASGTGVPGRHGWPGPRSAGVGTRRSLASRGTLVKRPVFLRASPQAWSFDAPVAEGEALVRDVEELLSVSGPRTGRSGRGGGGQEPPYAWSS